MKTLRPKLKALLVLALVWAQTPTLSLAQGNLEKVCSTAAEVCTKAYEFPTGLDPVWANVPYPCCVGTCKNCRSVPSGCCKQETVVSRVCRECIGRGRWERCAEWNCEWKTKISCWDCQVCVNTCCPKTCYSSNIVGTKIATKRLTGCEIASSAARLYNPGFRPELLSFGLTKLAKICPCLGQVPAFVESFTADSPTTAALQTAGKLLDCLVTNGFGVVNNLGSLRGSGELFSNTDVIIEGPPINNAFYISLVGAVTTCVASQGAKCDDVVNLFLEYFKKAGAIFGDALETFVKKVYVERLFNAVLGPVNAVKKAANDLPQLLRTQLQSCANAPFDEVFAAADAVSATANEFQTTLTSGQALVDNVSASIAVFSDVVKTLSSSYKQTLIDAVTTGKIPDFANSVKFLVDSNEIKSAISSASTFKGSLSKLQEDLGKLPSLATNLENAMKTLPTSCKVDLSPINAVKSQLQASQAAIKNVASIPVDLNTLQAGLATYNQWIPFVITIPCSSLTTKTFSGFNFASKLSLPFPSFYECSWGPNGGKVPMPNSFIPYLRLKGLKASTLAREELLGLEVSALSAVAINATEVTNGPLVVNAPASTVLAASSPNATLFTADMTQSFNFGSAVGTEADSAMHAVLERELQKWVNGEITNLTQAYDNYFAETMQYRSS